MKPQFVRLILVLGFLTTFFQNCAAPDVPTSSVAGSTLSAASTASGTATVLGTGMSATYQPQVISVGNQVVINGAGGSSPYTYSLTSGSGSLNGNVYTAPDFAEVAVILVQDHAGHSVSLSLNVSSSASGSDGLVAGGPGDSGNGSSSGGDGSGVVAVPTPVPPAHPSSADLVNVPNIGEMTRGSNCNLDSWAQQAQANTSVPAVVVYQYCLVLLRGPSSGEARSFADAIEGGDEDPYSVINSLAMSPEFAQKYNIPAMSLYDFTGFLSSLLLRTDATPDQINGVMLQAQQQGANASDIAGSERIIFGIVLQSTYFNQANPVMPAAESAWIDATN